jgi:hypothetical protein
MQYERRMKAITETSYAARLAADNMWATRVLRTTPIEGKTERVTWFLDTATIVPIGPSGSGAMKFENMVTQTAEYPTFKHGKGIRVQIDQLEDLDGTGLDQLAKWSENIGNETAYYPQRLASQLILNGANTDGSANAYDGLPFFLDNTVGSGNPNPGGTYSNGHYYNPYKPNLGGYYNWLHGSAVAASTGVQAYPGALPIDDVNASTTDVALKNLGLAIAYIASLKMPNGVDPRFLTPKYIIIPPRMAPRLRQLLDAKFIAQAASSGGGAADVMALITGWGLGKPVIAQELGASISYTFPMPFVVASTGNVSFLKETVTGSDTTYYIVCEENESTRLGSLLYVTRKPFKVRYFGEGGADGMDAILSRADELEYQCKGRMSCQYGHPYGIFRFDGT